ncbi:MAG: phosphate signaling complex protein PhoU [Candidatus Eisenbacteria bacterium]|nr:phosphate signaling complex protein PhoU [Candidatus Eisenbacteria bacterium]
MSLLLQREIEKVKRMILSLSAVVEESVQKAVTSIERRDVSLAREVIGTDNLIDQAEVDVEEECLKILALHQPVAGDLRLIIAVLKINNDLERIGDLAVNIAHRTLFLCSQPEVPPPVDFTEMSRRTLDMVHQSLDALVNMDAPAARAVLGADDEVDAINRQMFKRIFAAIRANPERTECLQSYSSATRYLERIADSATNIAEDVIYLVEGRIVRHGVSEPSK